MHAVEVVAQGVEYGLLGHIEAVKMPPYRLSAGSVPHSARCASRVAASLMERVCGRYARRRSRMAKPWVSILPQ